MALLRMTDLKGNDLDPWPMAELAFDLDGVLAEAPPPPAKGWRHMNGLERRGRRADLLAWYEIATPLGSLSQGGPSVLVITARRCDLPGVLPATIDWLAARPWASRIAGVAMLQGGRRLEAVVEAKAHAIATCGVLRYWEDHLAVVRGLQAHPLSSSCAVNRVDRRWTVRLRAGEELA